MQPVRFDSPQFTQLFQQLAAGTKLPLDLDTHGADIKSICVKDGTFCCRFRNDTQLFGFPALRQHWLQVDPSLAVKAAPATAPNAGILRAAPKAAPESPAAADACNSKGISAHPPAAAASSQPAGAHVSLHSSSPVTIDIDVQAEAAAAAAAAEAAATGVPVGLLSNANQPRRNSNGPHARSPGGAAAAAAGSRKPLGALYSMHSGHMPVDSNAQAAAAAAAALAGPQSNASQPSSEHPPAAHTTAAAGESDAVQRAALGACTRSASKASGLPSLMLRRQPSAAAAGGPATPGVEAQPPVAVLQPLVPEAAEVPAPGAAAVAADANLEGGIELAVPQQAPAPFGGVQHPMVPAAEPIPVPVLPPDVVPIPAGLPPSV